MKKRMFRNKKARYAGISVLLTVAVITVAVLLNAVVSSLVTRYGLYTSLLEETAFPVSEECLLLIDGAFSEAREEGRSDDVRVIFCTSEDELKEYESNNFYIHSTVCEIADRFDNVKVEYVNVYANPTEELRGYTVSYHPLTEEVIETPLTSDSLIIVAEDYYRVYNWTDFYAFTSSEDLSTGWAYTGDRRIASAFLSAMEGERRLAGLMMNHGETLIDYELMTVLSDAGYTVVTFDMYNEGIPKDCELLISYNPRTDLVSDELSERSEVEMLDEFLSTGGRAFYVFMGRATRELPNFEGYLGAWGVSPDYWTSNGVSYRYNVQHDAESLTSDGCTVYGKVKEGAKEEFISDAQFVVFPNATTFSVSPDNYLPNGDGSYTWEAKSRTLYPLYETDEDALSMANGLAVDGGSRMMLSVTEQENENGSSYVGAISSVKFAMREYLQSAVYGNSDVLLHLFNETGGPTNSEGLRLVPFDYREISTVTTAQILFWTVTLTAVPAVAVTTVALVVLIRRRRA